MRTTTSIFTPLLLLISFTLSAGASQLTSAFSSDGKFTTNETVNEISVHFTQSPEQESALAASNLATLDSSAIATSSILRWLILPPKGNFKTTVASAQFVSKLAVASPSSNLPRSDQIVRLGRPIIMRGVRLAPVMISPIIQDDQGEVQVLHEIDFTISPTDGRGQSEVSRSPQKISTVYHNLLTSFTINAESPHLPRRDPASSNLGKMLILIPDAYQDETGLTAINEFAEWKRRSGLEVAIRSIDAVGLTSREIRSIIGEGYPDDPYDYTVIIGWDRSHVGYDALAELEFPGFEQNNEAWMVQGGDLFYATLDDDGDTPDYMPDIMIGRMIIPNTESLLGVLNRSILYEQAPYPGRQGHVGEWFSNALIVNDHFDDFNEPSVLDEEVTAWIDSRLKKLDMNVTTLNATINEAYNQERQILGEGMSVVIANGDLPGATSYDDPRITANTNEMNPFVISGGYIFTCPTIDPFFASASLQHRNGPIATITQLMYCQEYWTRATNIGVAHCLSDLRINRVGEIFLQAISYNLEYFPEDFRASDSIYFVRYLHNYSVFGDPSVEIYTENPVQLRIVPVTQLTPGATAVNFRVTDEQRDVADATICIRQPDHFQYVLTTDANGMASFTVPEGLSANQLQVTALKKNCRAAVEDFEVTAVRGNLVLASVEIMDQGIGDNDGRLRNAESVDLRLTFSNTGDAPVLNSLATFSSNSPYLHFARNNSRLVDIAVGGEGGQRQPVRVTLDSNCPGGDTIRIQVDVTADRSEWNTALELVTSGPRYIVSPEQIEVAHGEPGQVTRINPSLTNLGDFDGEQLTATLISNTDGVTVTQGERSYPAVQVGASRPLAQPFEVIFAEQFVPGFKTEFTLRLTGEHEGERTLQFEVPSFSPDTTDPVGPDSYGYLCFSSGDTLWREAPKYNWVEINPYVPGQQFDGEALDLHDQTNWSGGREESADNTLIDLPFTFRYYGREYNQLVVCSNGWVSFDTNVVNYKSPFGAGIPGVAPDAQISLCWQDLMQGNYLTSGYYSYYYREAGMFIVEWSGTYAIGDTIIDEIRQMNPIPIEFQIQLYDPQFVPTVSGDGDIVVQYKQFTVVKGRLGLSYYPTIGIRNPDGTDGIEYTHQGKYNVSANPITSGSALKFTTSSTAVLNRRVSGQLVYQENQQPVSGAKVSHPRAVDVTTDESGRFSFDARIGTYKDFQISKLGYNTLQFDLTIPNDNDVQLGTLNLTHPELAPVNPFSLDLRPDGSQTTQSITLLNQGNGPLQYEAKLSYADGSDASFDTLVTFNLSVMFPRSGISSPIWIDSLFYVPYRAADSLFIGRMTRTGVVRAPIKLGRIETDNGITSLTWDGTHFWCCIANFEGIVRIYEIDLQGRFGRTILPENQLQHYGTGACVFSPERKSLFVCIEDVQITEYSLKPEEFGRVIDDWEIHTKPVEINVRGLGWNRDDPEGMPLYLLAPLFEGDSIRQSIYRANPETHEVEPWRYLQGTINYNPFGGSVTSTFDKENLCILVCERRGVSRNLRVMKIGPNTSFLKNGLESRVGTVEAGASGTIDMTFDASGLAENTYRFGVRIEHNGIDSQMVVPFTFVVSNTAGMGDGRDLSPLEFGIEEVYPNPANSSILVNFTLPTSERVKICVYDVSGRQAAKLLEGNLEAGKHAIPWTAVDKASGIYIVRLEAGNRSASTKFMLIK